MDSRRLVVWISTGILGFQGATLAFDLLNCTHLGSGPTRWPVPLSLLLLLFCLRQLEQLVVGVVRGLLEPVALWHAAQGADFAALGHENLACQAPDRGVGALLKGVVRHYQGAAVDCGPVADDQGGDGVG